MKKVDIAYWKSEKNQLDIVGSANSVNEAGSLLVRFIDIQKGLGKDCIYFRIDEDKVVMFDKDINELHDFISQLFDEQPPQPPIN